MSEPVIKGVYLWHKEQKSMPYMGFIEEQRTRFNAAAAAVVAGLAGQSKVRVALKCLGDETYYVVWQETGNV